MDKASITNILLAILIFAQFYKNRFTQAKSKYSYYLIEIRSDQAVIAETLKRFEEESLEPIYVERRDMGYYRFLVRKAK